MMQSTRRDEGRVARRITLEQRRVLLERIRRDVAGVVEDIQASAASLEAVGVKSREVSAAERAMIQMIGQEQQRQQLELVRLYGEYRSLVFPRRAGKAATEGVAAAA